MPPYPQHDAVVGPFHGMGVYRIPWMAAAVRQELLRQELAFCAKQPCDYNVREVCLELQSVVTGLDGGHPPLEDMLCYRRDQRPQR